MSYEDANNELVNVVSFSGGRTSAYLVHLMELLRNHSGINVHYIFMDTGAEHPKTYQFIRDVVRYWDIDLTCLRVEVNPELGKANGYKIIPLEEIGPDLQPWKDICAKYGTPYFGGAFCTRTMKIEVCERYCRDRFAMHESWLGMRADEQARIWGVNIYPLIKRLGFNCDEALSLFVELRGFNSRTHMVNFMQDAYLIVEEDANKIAERVIKVKGSKQRFLAEITSYEKDDILKWWSSQAFDLDLEEHLGNCVFCVKKGLNKIALALRDEPEMAEKFKEVIYSTKVRVVESRQQENKIMYRGCNSLEAVEAIYVEHNREEIASTIKGTKSYEAGSCTESCEAFTVGDDALELMSEAFSV